MDQQRYHQQASYVAALHPHQPSLPLSLPLPSIHAITNDPRFTSYSHNHNQNYNQSHSYNLPPLNFASTHSNLPVTINTTTSSGIPPHISNELNKISRVETYLPEQNFQLSASLIEDLNKSAGEHSIASLQDRICTEAKEYAEKRKAIVRAELKERLQGNNTKFTAREKGKLRSRREAKVHRVKEQQTELALKASIAYLIELKEEAQRRKNEPCTCKYKCCEKENTKSSPP